VPHGWLILDKPVGLGSTQAVAAVKRNMRAAGFAKVKVGHGGTLDPLASGVLPIALGEATKLAGRMLDSDKAYEFTIGFGVETDTLDLEGQTVAQSAVRPTLAKIDGERAYDRARRGDAVELAVRHVAIHSLLLRHAELVSASMERRRDAAREERWTLQRVQGDESLCSADFTAHVSKGTYIRSLARDIARALGTVGHVTHLRRTRAGPFALDRAISLDKLNEVGQGAALEPLLLPLEAGLDGIPALDLTPDQARAAHQGRVLTGLAFSDGVCWARSGDTPLALMQVEGGSARVLRGFNLPDAAE
jgi:tRNA pseudouridine55 synthase